MTGKTVLVAHRTPAVRERFVAALADAGHAAVAVASADEVLRAAETSGAADLVLVDAGLPHDMVAALAGLTGSGDHRPTVVVFGSTVSGADQVRTLAQAGVRAYVNDFAAPAQIVGSLAPFLFHDNFNRRASPRVAVAMGVSCRVNGAVSAATALNIGRGGIALRVLAPVAVGTTMRLRFRVPPAARDLDVEARVCWTDANLGLGAQFEHVAADDQALIDAFVDGQAGD